MNKKQKTKLVAQANILGMIFLNIASALPEAKVSMISGEFNYQCGTIACHAGWFGVALGKSKVGGEYEYTNAADEMAKFLGFNSLGLLLNWALKNPNIWGNKQGRGMFSSPIAFGSCYGITLDKIGKHWLKVAALLEDSL